MNQHVDVIIIGAGTAGLSAQSQVARKTDNYVLISDGPYGASCARVACMPTKTLLEAAHAFRQRQFLGKIGVEGATRLAVDRRRVLEHVRQMRDGFVGPMVNATKKLGEKTIAGRARFVDADTVEVNGTRITGKRIIIATGSRPIVPEQWKAFGSRVISTDMFFEEKDLPRRMAVVGLGPAGIEFAQALANLGVDVVGFDAQSFIGGLSDPQVNDVALKTLGAELSLYMDQKIGIREEDGLVIDCAAGSFPVDKVLLSMGRRPNLDGLGLDALNIEMTDDGVPVYDSETLRLASLPIYIAGDAKGTRPILHEAVDEGRIAGYNAVQETDQRFRRRTPLAITFTEPNIAKVGKSFCEMDRGSGAGTTEPGWVIGEQSLEGQLRARMTDTDKGLMRIYASKDQGRLLGAEMLARAGEHLAHLLAWSIQGGLTVHDLLSRPFYHPTVEEGLQDALKILQRTVSEKKHPLKGLFHSR